VRPERDFEGQRFVRHVASVAAWTPFRLEGFESRDTGIADATGGIATVRVARLRASPSPGLVRHDADFLFTFVLSGSMTLEMEGEEARSLSAGTALVLPSGRHYAFAGGSSDLELLEVALPARFETISGTG
jgi:mannose-6-phosphate isomerase-like protein (cupin superfamily)